MKWQTSLVIGLLVVIVASAILLAEAQEKPSFRFNFKLPRLFDFERFKNLFRKTYGSVVEELARKRLFLARSFGVFVSAVSYKHFKSSSYQSVNEMSDWTPMELRKTHVNVNLLEKKALARASNEDGIAADVPSPSGELKLPVADFEEIKQKLAEIKERPEEPGYREISSELDELSRHKRDTSDHPEEVRNLRLADLFRAPRRTRQRADRVSSNNPNYIEPELTSLGASESAPTGEGDSRLSSEDANKILGYMPGFLSSAISVTSRLFTYSQSSRPDNVEDIVHVDHRESGCFFEPRVQGKCGSCYAFATIALYEWYYCNATDKHVPFSEQYIIDCGKRFECLLGCNGGAVAEVSDFVNEYGLELRARYPYRTKDDECPYDSDTSPESMGYLRIEDQGFFVIDPDDIREKLNEQPLSFSMYISEDFHSYGGGVHYPDCSKAKPEDGHATLLVGSGREDGQDYWLVRNSYGVSWGEGGYYKLNTKATNCVIIVARLSSFKVTESEEPPRDMDFGVKRRYHTLVREDLGSSKRFKADDESSTDREPRE